MVFDMIPESNHATKNHAEQSCPAQLATSMGASPIGPVLVTYSFAVHIAFKAVKCFVRMHRCPQRVT